MKILIQNILVLILFLSFSSGFAQSIPDSIPTKKEKGSLEKDIQKTEIQTKKEIPESEKKKDTPAAEEKKVTQTQEEKKETLSEKIQKKPEEKIPAKDAEKKAIKSDLPPSQKEKESLSVPQKKYTQQGIMEIGGIAWGQFRGITKGYDSQFLTLNAFTHYFIVDYFLTGIRAECTYNFDEKSYQASGYAVAGGAFPLGEDVFLSLSLNIGYSRNNTASSKSLFSYGNEMGLKIRLKGNYLLGISALYSFYTDFTKDFFNDKIKGMIYFSGYF